MNTKFIVKASLFTLILAFMAIGMIAIAEVMKREQPTEVERMVVLETWYFTGGDPNSPDSYSNDEADQVSCVTPYQTICTIQAPADGDQPDFTEVIDGKTVGQHIEDAVESLQTSTPLPPNAVVTAYRAN